MNKKIISLLGCLILVISLVGCTQIKDRNALKEQMKSEIESYEDILGKGNYKIYIEGNTLVMEEHEDSNNLYGWKNYDLGGSELVDSIVKRSELVKDLIKMKGGSENCHARIIMKDFNTDENFIIVEDGNIIYNCFDDAVEI